MGSGEQALVPDLSGSALVWRLDPDRLPWHSRPALAVWGGGLAGGAAVLITTVWLLDAGAFDGIQWWFLGETSPVDPALSAALIGALSCGAYAGLLHWYQPTAMVSALLARLVDTSAPQSAGLQAKLTELEKVRQRIEELAGIIGINYPLDHVRPPPRSPAAATQCAKLELDVEQRIRTDGPTSGTWSARSVRSARCTSGTPPRRRPRSRPVSRCSSTTSLR
jgi:hypothetical protein